MRARFAALMWAAGAAAAGAQSAPSDSAHRILITARAFGDLALGELVADSTRAHLSRLLVDRSLSVILHPDSYSLVEPSPVRQPWSTWDLLQLGRTFRAEILIEVGATSRPSGQVRLAPMLVLRHGPPLALDPIDARDAPSAATNLANRIASDSGLRQRAIDDAAQGCRGLPCVTSGVELQPRGPVYFEFQVDRPAALVASSARPRYPDAARPRNLKGEVLAQFVVDSVGRADPRTFKALTSPFAPFSQAVRDALPDMTFTPAERGGHRVSQLVQIVFQFDPSKP